MRFIKLGLISIVVIFILLTAISSLLPSTVLVSRAVDINSPAADVKEQVFRLENWQNWLSDEMGNKGTHQLHPEDGALVIGNARIVGRHTTDTTFTTTWKNGRDMKGSFRIIKHASTTGFLTVQWQMEQHVRWYPWEKFASITKDEIWGGAMEKSLENLRTFLEAHPTKK